MTQIKTIKAFGREREILPVAGRRYFLTSHKGRIHAVLGDPTTDAISDFFQSSWSDYLDQADAFTVTPNYFLGFVKGLLASRGKEVVLTYDDKKLYSDNGANDIVGFRHKTKRGNVYLRFRAPCGDYTDKITREDWKSIAAFLVAKGAKA